MNKIEKLLGLGLILLCVAGSVQCMDDEDDDTEYFDWDPEDNGGKGNEDKKPADKSADNPGQPEKKPEVGGGKKPADIDKKLDGEAKKVTFTTDMMVQGAGATAIVVTIGGIWYCVTHSVLKQVADLNRLDSRCAQAFGTVVRGNSQFECLVIESVTCVGLEPQLQDRLDDAVALYAMAVKDLCCAMKVNGKGKAAQLPQYGTVQAKLLICKQLISECKEALNKKPILADRILISSSQAVTSIGRRAMGTATSLVNRVKSLTARKVKKA